MEFMEKNSRKSYDHTWYVFSIEFELDLVWCSVFWGERDGVGMKTVSLS